MSASTGTVRKARWTDDGLTVAEVELGPLSEGWARLEVAACGICGSDLHFWDGTMGRPLGTAPGHELVGTVVDGPSSLDDVLYAVSPMLSCGSCAFCDSGRPQQCDRALFGGIGLGLDGGLADVVDAPVANLAPAGTDDPLTASLTEPLAVSVRGLGLAPVQASSRVLVLGAGTIGLCAGLLARDRALEVAITARHPHQAAAADALGLTVLAEDEGRAWARDRGADVVVESVGGGASTMEEAVVACRKGGTIVVLGVFTDPRPVDLAGVMLKELSIVGSFAYGTSRREREFATAARLTGRYSSDLPALLTHQFALADVTAAFETAADKSSGAIKVSLLPGR